MRGIQGALIAASSLQIIIGFSGLWRNVVRWVSNWFNEVMLMKSIKPCNLLNLRAGS